MPSASLISSVVSRTPNAVLPAAGRKDAPSFSYDDAVAALERSTARALNVHGGAPSQKVTGARGPESRAPQDAAAAPTPAHEPAVAASGEQTAAPETAAPSSKEKLPSPALSPSIVPAASVSFAAAPQPAQTTLQPAPATQGVREAAARLKAGAPRPAPPTHAPAQTLRQFAEILARRLEGASQFDLRLDPPALGTVDGRLTLADDGQAVLALAFDNQSAFDLFRRDEAALREALAGAGFDLGGHELRFSFREPMRDGAPDARRDSAATGLAPEFASPSPLHRGAIDIRA